jgi:hypothetical protein
MQHVKVNPRQRRRAKPLIAFDVPLRRKFPVAQPAILERLNKTFNKERNFDMRGGLHQRLSGSRRIKSR